MTKGGGGVQVEPLVEVDPDAQAPLVEVEEASQPGAEQDHQLRVAVGEDDLAVALRALSGVQRRPGHEEFPLRQRADARRAVRPQPLDLLLLAPL
ncbi:MAG: hypothetical protein M3276_00870 [Actinomycetota bacterium]|nr:hypothetical protein [Actinomycetota bacterium]